MSSGTSSPGRATRLAAAIAGSCAIAAFALSGASADAARSPTEVVDAFNAAIDRADRTDALSFLTRDVILFEAGFADRSRSDYESVHLGLDIAFARTTQRTLRSRRQGGEGDLYWVASLYTDEGEFEGRPLKHSTAETVLLRRVGGRWRIAHLHWSSEFPGDAPGSEAPGTAAASPSP